MLFFFFLITPVRQTSWSALAVSMEPVAQERGRSAQSTQTKAGHPRWSRAHGGPCPSGQDCGFTSVSHALASLFPNPFRCAAAVWRRQSCKDALPRSTGDLLCMFLGAAGKAPLWILCPMFPSTQLPRKCLQPSWRVAAVPLALDCLHHLHLHQSCGEPAQDILVQISHFFQQTPLTYFKIILCFTEPETWWQIFAKMAFIPRNSYF